MNDKKNLSTLARVVGRAVLALPGTEGRRIARRNARQKVLSALGAVRTELDKQYPSIDKNGKSRTPPKYIICPHCNAPMKSWKALAKHVAQLATTSQDIVDRNGIGNWNQLLIRYCNVIIVNRYDYHTREYGYCGSNSTVPFDPLYGVR